MEEKTTIAQTASSSVNSVLVTLPVRKSRKADQKEYADMRTGRAMAVDWKTKGTIRFTGEAVAALALISCYEVPGLARRIEKAYASRERIIQKSKPRGIKVHFIGDKVQIDLAISVKPGYTAVYVAKQVQLTVKKNIENMAGICVSAVNVHVSSVQIQRNLLNAPLKEKIS